MMMMQVHTLRNVYASDVPHCVVGEMVRRGWWIIRNIDTKGGVFSFVYISALFIYDHFFFLYLYIHRASFLPASIDEI